MTLKFKDYEYKRPIIEEVEAAFHTELEKFQNAASVEEQSKAMHKINEI